MFLPQRNPPLQSSDIETLVNVAAKYNKTLWARAEAASAVQHILFLSLCPEG